MKKRSPPPKKYMKKTVKYKEEKSDKTTGKIDMTGWVVPTGCEPVPKTCRRGCLKKGHIWINCPDNVEKALVGKDEEGDDWEEEEDYNTFVIAGSRKRGREFTMFLGEEILLDNQASQCIFHNEGLLHGVIEREPYNMCGIDRGQSRLRVDRTGRILGFEKIGATVGLAEKASANILAQARLIDAGYGVRYDSSLDQYEVDTDSPSRERDQESADSGRRHEESENHLEADRGIHERENQPPEAADSDARPERQSDSSLTDVSGRHYVCLPHADTSGTTNAARADSSERPQG